MSSDTATDTDAGSPPPDRPTLATRSTLAARPALRVTAWSPPGLDAAGHDPRSAYVERFWLPILGPSTVLLLRHLATALDSAPGGFLLDLEETARALGLGVRDGPHAPLARALRRAVDFAMATEPGPGQLAVRRRIPSLSTRQVARLPASLQVAHARALGQGGSAEGVAVRARRLALSLLRVGEAEGAAETQLLAWRFPPELARGALAWARSQLDGEAGRSGGQLEAKAGRSGGEERGERGGHHRGVGGAGQLASGVHRELSEPDVDGRDAEAGSEERADGGTARQVRTVGEGLEGHPRDFAGGSERGGS